MYHYLYQQLSSFGVLFIGHGPIAFHSLKWGGIFHEPKCYGSTMMAFHYFLQTYGGFMESFFKVIYGWVAFYCLIWVFWVYIGR